MRALVTGANGFVGRHLVAHLWAAGDDVITCDRAGAIGDRGATTHLTVDVTDPERMQDAVTEARPDVVYHLAGWSHVGASWDAPREVFRINAEGTLNLLLAAASAGAGRVLAISSADIYGIVTEDELPLTEESPLRPVTPYAASKVAADFLGLQAWLGWKLPVIRVRAFNHFGPGQAASFLAPAVAHRIAVQEIERGDVVSIGNLGARRDFTDVRDVVRAYRLLAERGTPGEAYNVCSGVDVAVADLADRLVAMAKRPMRLESDPALERAIDIPVLRGDPSKLRAATGWEPQIPIDETLADILQDARERVLSGSASPPVRTEK